MQQQTILMIPTTRQKSVPRRDSYLASLATIKYKFRRKSRYTLCLKLLWLTVVIWLGLIGWGWFIFQNSKEYNFLFNNYIQKQQQSFQEKFGRLKKSVKGWDSQIDSQFAYSLDKDKIGWKVSKLRNVLKT